jgi:predicted metalloprotease with PDZ domain
MKILKLYIIFGIMIALSSCIGIGTGDDKRPTADQNFQSAHAAVKKTKLIHYDKTDPFWQQKKAVDSLLPKLSSAEWDQREAAEKQLIDFVAVADSSTLDYFILQSSKNSDPEINFRAKKVLQSYFHKAVYDPDRKKGFIGLQLMEHGGIMIKNEHYLPIRVVLPQDGFPGKKAGIMQGDLILGVDGKICGRKFSMNNFIMYIAALKPGTMINLVLFRHGNIISKKIKLGTRPETIHDPASKKSEKELFNDWYKGKRSGISR